MNFRKRILVAPLNWGLGHATRCIPIINALINQNFEPVIASDGSALKLLQKEFPKLKTIELPSYNIQYSKKASGLKWKLLRNAPHIVKTIKLEYNATQSIIDKYDIKGIISDNRFGVRGNTVPSVFLTHQVQVLSGNTTWISTALHKKIIKKFDECWIPDYSGDINLSGKLGHPITSDINLKYIGPLSRFKKQKYNSEFDVLVLISGPEPQRSLLQEKLLEAFENYDGEVLFVHGLVEKKQLITRKKHITSYNFMTSLDLEKAIQKSKIVVSRSGYTSIMDLAKMKKDCYFIPTPGQFEQEYLANRLKDQHIVPSCNQNEFTLEKLKEIKKFKGLSTFDFDTDYSDLFRLFECE
ncbi:glycosyltransferase [Flavobacteriales bacterium 34_180_T64]|nr:glycosyltransferase [Flavobacteriales bacterium 34_180_T64]